MTKTKTTSFRMSETTRDKLDILSEWDGHGNLTSSVELAIIQRYMQVRAQRIAAGLPVDDPTPQEASEE